MKYIAPMQICNANYKTSLEYIYNNQNLCIFSCWCLNLNDLSELRKLPNTLLVQNNIEVLYDREKTLCYNLLYKHIVSLLGIHEYVAVLKDSCFIPDSTKQITFIDSNNILIKKNENTHSLFKQLEKHVADNIGIYNDITVSYEEMLKEVNQELFQALI